jgi:hypothetical protein
MGHEKDERKDIACSGDENDEVNVWSYKDG